MSENIDIVIKSSGDTKYELNVSPDITVLELKKQIEEKSSIPADRQRLIYSGKVLKDSETFSFYKVKQGHTIHLVKSAGTKTSSDPASSAPAASTTSSTAATAGAGSGAASTASSAGIPSMSAGQGSYNPLADLTGARYAGYTQLPSASMFGPDGGMNQNIPDPEQMSRMMSNPAFQQQMNQMMSDPQMLDFMINQSPELRAMGPQVREMLQSPYFRQMMSNPEMLRSMMQMGRGMRGGPGAAGAGGFPAPGNATGESSDNSESTPGSDAGAGAGAANPFASMFPGGVPPMDPFALFGGGGAGAGAGQAAAAVDNRPPEERYESQLRQLNDMGFFDFDRNIEALRRTGGSVQGAIEYLLSHI